jgi:hypothetical protein
MPGVYHAGHFSIPIPVGCWLHTSSMMQCFYLLLMSCSTWEIHACVARCFACCARARACPINFKCSPGVGKLCPIPVHTPRMLQLCRDGPGPCALCATINVPCCPKRGSRRAAVRAAHYSAIPHLYLHTCLLAHRVETICTVYSETRAKILFGCFLCYLANKSPMTQIETLNPITIASAHSCL